VTAVYGNLYAANMDRFSLLSIFTCYTAKDVRAPH